MPRPLFRLALTALALALASASRADDLNARFKGLKFAHKDDGAAAMSSGQGDGHGKPLASTPHVIVGALSAAQAELGARGWDFSRARSDFARALGRDYSSFESDLGPLVKRKYFEPFAEKGGTVVKLNKWLQDRKLDLRLQPEGDRTSLALAAVAKLAIRWKHQGQAVKLKLDDRSEVDAAWLRSAKFYDNREEMGREPIVELEGEKGEKVYFARYGRVFDDDPASAWREARRLMDGMRPSQARFAGVIFPKVAFDSFKLNPGGKAAVPLQDVCTTGAPALYCVKQFVLEQKLDLDQEGATADPAAGIAIGPGGPFPYTVTGDFLVWVRVDGVIPFAGLVTKPSMKDPKSL